MINKILITGGAGFISSAVILHIIHNSGHSIFNVGKLTYAGNLASLRSIKGRGRYAFEWFLDNMFWCDSIKDGSYQNERRGSVL